MSKTEAEYDLEGHSASGTLCGHVLTLEEAAEIHSDIAHLIRPSWLTFLPPKLGLSSHRKRNADQWRVLGTNLLPITLIRLWSNSDGTTDWAKRCHHILETTLHLVSAVVTATSQVTSAEHAKNWGLYTLPPFPGRLHSDSNGLNLSRMPIFWLWSCWNFPVTFWCRSARLVSPTDFPMDCPSDFHQTRRQIPLEMTGQQWKVWRKSGGLQWTPSRQPSLLVLLIKNINSINKPNNTLNQIVHY